MVRLFLLNIVVLLGTSSLVDAQKPYWVEKLPVDSEFYIGVGISAKNINRNEYIKKAKDNALNDLAAQIKINISSEFIERLTSKSETVKQDIISQIRTSTKEELEGYELVDTWEDKSEYWVYYRLSKSHYKTQKELKLGKATTLSLDFFSKAKQAEKDMELDKALMCYFQAILPLEKYIDEPLKVTYENSDIFLMNEMYFSIQNLLSKIKLNPSVNQFDAKVGQPLGNPLEINVIYNSSSGSQSAGPQLPIKFMFLEGSGEFSSETKTDLKGLATCQITKITSKKKIQIVQAFLNIYSFLTQSEDSIIIQSIIKSFSVPSAQIVINVSGLPVFIKSTELQFGEKLDILFIDPLIKKKLAEEGFIFTDDVTNAYLIITVNAESRKGAQVTGMDAVTSFLDLTISVKDTTGNEIYKNSLLGVKGFGRDYNIAGLKAFEKAGNSLNEEIILDLIKHVQQ